MQQFCVIGGCSTIMAKRGSDDMQNNCIRDFKLSASSIPRDNKGHTHWQQIMYVQVEVTHST